jgi:hypothetical protein
MNSEKMIKTRERDAFVFAIALWMGQEVRSADLVEDYECGAARVLESLSANATYFADRSQSVRRQDWVPTDFCKIMNVNDERRVLGLKCNVYALRNNVASMELTYG